nr:DnaJ homolog subfamily B member 1-like [Ipomoea batatas]
MENIRGGPGGGTFGGEEPTSSRFNPRSVDDIFAEISEILEPFGGIMDGGPGMRDGRFGSMFGDHMFSSFGEGGGGSMRQSAHRKAPPIEQTIPCSLEDLYKGTTKKFKVSREIIVGNGKRMPVEEILIINIKPGWKKGTKITFSEKGNEYLGIIPADLVFIIDEKPHKLFTRDGNDLVATLKINLVEAPGYTVHLTTLDDRNLTIPIKTTIHPHCEGLLQGEGMPISKDPSKKGNLRIKFDIET